MVLIAAQPTRGLDVQGIAAIQQHVSQRADRASELTALSDRLAVMFDGEVVAIFDPTRTTRAEVGSAMAGQAVQAAAP